jgi:hypothetical protein
MKYKKQMHLSGQLQKTKMRIVTPQYLLDLKNQQQVQLKEQTE